MLLGLWLAKALMSACCGDWEVTWLW